MGEPALKLAIEPLRRRSTRIARAVPLLVSGVEALGRSFAEPTSTSVVSCHGCRYLSRHYVGRNGWITLEVLRPEAGRVARRVRGRVAWIQRPRALREPFHYGVELAVPGNFWEIDCSLEDWFSFPEGAEYCFDPGIVLPAPPEGAVRGEQ